MEVIKPYLKGKDILDVGCVEHTLERMHQNKYWYHDFLKEQGKSVVGIDIVSKDIKTLRKRGYDVYCKNAESFRFNKQFDVIFAGYLIEHLSNQGLFLDQCRKHLKDSGVLIVSTYQAFALRYLFQSLRTNNNMPENNSEHTVWYSPDVLNTLLERHGFTCKSMAYIDSGVGNTKGNWNKKFRKLLEKLRGDHTKEHFVMICVKNGKR